MLWEGRRHGLLGMPVTFSSFIGVFNYASIGNKTIFKLCLCTFQFSCLHFHSKNMDDTASVICYRLMSAVTERAESTVAIAATFYGRLRVNVEGKNVLLVKIS